MCDRGEVCSSAGCTRGAGLASLGRGLIPFKSFTTRLHLSEIPVATSHTICNPAICEVLF